VLVAAKGAVDRLNLTLKESDYLILKAGLTADTAKKASDKELLMLDAWNGEITRTMHDVDATALASSTGLAAVSAQTVMSLRQVQITVGDIQPVLHEATADLLAAHHTIDDANSLLADPDLRLTLANTQAATGNVQAMTADTRQALHHYLHPSWPEKIWHGISNGIVETGKFLF
jgi:hypothetical protein